MPTDTIKSIQGRVALVTGASSGMGAEIARELARHGTHVVAVARDSDRLNATVSDVEAAGATGLAVQADITDDKAARDAVDQAIASFGRLDILVNAAGIYRPAVFDDGLPSLDAEWRINMRAPYVLTQAAIPYLRDRHGTVVFISSVCGTRAFPEATSYCATKGALESFSAALALEEASSGVRVNVVAPGEIATSLNRNLLANPAYEKAIVDATPLGRVGTVFEIAPAVAFLVSDAASYITGARLAVDGGWAAS